MSTPLIPNTNPRVVAVYADTTTRPILAWDAEGQPNVPGERGLVLAHLLPGYCGLRVEAEQ